MSFLFNEKVQYLTISSLNQDIQNIFCSKSNLNLSFKSYATRMENPIYRKITKTNFQKYCLQNMNE